MREADEPRDARDGVPARAWWALRRAALCAAAVLVVGCGSQASPAPVAGSTSGPVATSTPTPVAAPATTGQPPIVESEAALLAGSKWVVRRGADPRERGLVRRRELWFALEPDGFAYGRAGCAVFTGRWELRYGTVTFDLDERQESGECRVGWSFLGSLLLGASFDLGPDDFEPTRATPLRTGDLNDRRAAYTLRRVPLPRPIARSGTYIGMRIDELPTSDLVRIVEQEGVGFVITLELRNGRHNLTIRNARVVHDEVEAFEVPEIVTTSAVGDGA